MTGFRVKRMARQVLASPPAYHLLRARARRGDPVVILCYHTLGADDEVFDAWTVSRLSDFRAQIAAIRADYDIVSLDDALDTPRSQGARPRAVITFDDGDAGLSRNLLPLLDRERIKVTVYVATRQIESRRPYWFDEVINALQAPGPFELDLRDSGLPVWSIGPERGAARWFTISAILEALKDVRPERRDALAAEVVARAPASEGGFTPLAPMSVPDLAELARSPWVTIGSHSHGHELLDQIPDEAVRASVVRSRTLLETWTGRPIRHFAYPNGNHNATVRSVIADLGFRSAAALGGRPWRRLRGGLARAELFSLPRLPIGRYDDLDRFRLRLLGI